MPGLSPVNAWPMPEIVEEREAQDAKDRDNKKQPDVAAKARLAFPGRFGFRVFVCSGHHGTFREPLSTREGKAIDLSGL